MDKDLLFIILVICLIVLCLAPDIREIVLVISLCMNAIRFSSELNKTRKRKAKETPIPPPKKLAVVPPPAPPIKEHMVGRQQQFSRYPGRIDVTEEDPIAYDDRVAKVSIERPGADPVRQIKGSMFRKQTILPFVQNEVETDEFKQWWGNYDY